MREKKGRGGLPALHELEAMPLAAGWGNLNGVRGENRTRQPDSRRQIDADNDLEAIESWLGTIENPNTLRAYRKEAYRLLLWSISVRSKPVSSLKVEDLRTYLDWLAAPVRPASWPLHWQLIQGPLKLSSRRQAKVILQALFDYLVHAAYLAANPFRLLGKKQRGHAAIAMTGGLTEDGEIALPRWLEPELWTWILSFLNTLPCDTSRQKARCERLRFLLTWLYRTAARRSELAGGKMAHIHFMHGLWLWRIAGKGGSVEDVPLDQEALDALIRYRRFRGLPDYPIASEIATPIVTALNGENGVEGLQIYSALKWFFEQARQVAANENLGWAAKLASASTHWLRHSLASHAARAGIPIHLTAERLRHKSQATTQRFYVHASLTDQIQAFSVNLSQFALGNLQSDDPEKEP